MDTASSQNHSHFQPALLKGLLGRADAPLILDVRREAKFQESSRIVCGALRVAPEQIPDFARSQAPRDALVYCVYGHNVSAEANAALHAQGWSSQAIAGGIEGGQAEGADADSEANVALWRSERLPTILKRPDWGVTGEKPSRWITRERPKIDRIACPWLILRFIDPRAEFFYVPTETVFTQAKTLNAVPYDIPGAPVSHEGAHGEWCSFDALLKGFDLQLPALDLLATIVRGADTDRLDLTMQSAGLLAVSLGMSQLHTDDLTMLNVMLPVYDALYAWCSHQVAGVQEGHRWQSATV